MLVSHYYWNGLSRICERAIVTLYSTVNQNSVKCAKYAGVTLNINVLYIELGMDFPRSV